MSASNLNSPVECGFYEVDAYKKVPSYTTPINTGIPQDVKDEFTSFTYIAGSSRIITNANNAEACVSVAWAINGSILTLTEMSPDLAMTKASFAFDLGINLLPYAETVSAPSFASTKTGDTVLAVYIVSVNNIIFRLEFPYPTTYSDTSVFSSQPHLHSTSFTVPTDAAYDLSTPELLAKLQFTAVDASTLVFSHPSSAIMVLKPLVPEQHRPSTQINLAEQPASSMQSLFGLFKAFVPVATQPPFTVLAVEPLTFSTASTSDADAVQYLLAVCSDKKLRIWSSERGVVHTLPLRTYETHQIAQRDDDATYPSKPTISTALITRAADNQHTFAVYTSYDNAAMPIVDVLVVSQLPAQNLPELRTRTSSPWVTAALTSPTIDDTHVSGVDNSFTLSSCNTICVCYLDSIIDKPAPIRASVHTVQDHGAAIVPRAIVAARATVWVLYGVGVLSAVRAYTLALAFKHNSSEFPTLVNIDVDDIAEDKGRYTMLKSIRVAFPVNGKGRSNAPRIGKDGKEKEHSHRSLGNLVPSTPIKGSTRSGTAFSGISLSRANSAANTPALRRDSSAAGTPPTHRRGASTGVEGNAAQTGTISRTGTGNGSVAVTPCTTQWQTVLTAAEAQWLLEAKEDSPESLLCPPVSLAEHYLMRLFKPGRFPVEVIVRAVNYMRDEIELPLLSASFQLTERGTVGFAEDAALDSDGVICVGSIAQLQKHTVDTVLQYAHRLCEDEGISIPSGKPDHSEDSEESEAYDSIILDVWTKIMYFTYTVAEASSPSLSIYGMGFSCLSATPVLIKPRNISLLLPLDALSALTLTQQLSLPLSLQIALPSLPLPEGTGSQLLPSAGGVAGRSSSAASAPASAAAVTTTQRILALASLFSRVRCHASGDVYQRENGQTAAVDDLIVLLKEDVENATGSGISSSGVSEAGLSALGTGPWRQHVVEPFVFPTDPMFMSVHAIINAAKTYIDTIASDSAVFAQNSTALLDSIQQVIAAENISTLKTSFELLMLLLAPDCDHSLHGSSVFTFPALDAPVPANGQGSGASRVAVMQGLWSVTNVTITARIHLLHNLLVFLAFISSNLDALNSHVRAPASSSLSVVVDACDCEPCSFYGDIVSRYLPRVALLYKHYQFIHFMSQTLLQSHGVLSLAQEERDIDAPALPLASVLPAVFTRSLMTLQEQPLSANSSQSSKRFGVLAGAQSSLSALSATAADSVAVPYGMAADTTITSSATVLAQLMQLLAETQPDAAASSLIFASIRSLGLYSSAAATSAAKGGNISPRAFAKLLAVLAVLKQYQYIPVVLAFAHSLVDANAPAPTSAIDALKIYAHSLSVGPQSASVISALLQTSTAMDFNALVDPEYYLEDAVFPNISPMPSLSARALPGMQSAWAASITSYSHPLISEIALACLLQHSPPLSMLASLCSLAAHVTAEYARHVAFALQARTNATADVAAAADVVIHRMMSVAKSLSAAVSRCGDENIRQQCSTLLIHLITRMTDISILNDAHDQPLVPQTSTVTCYTLQFDMALSHGNLTRAHQALLQLPEDLQAAQTRKFILAALAAPRGVKTLLSLSWSTMHSVFTSCLASLAATSPLLPCLPAKVQYMNNRLVAQGKASTSPSEVLFAYYSACGEHNNAAHAMYLYVLRIEAEVLAQCFNSDGEVTDANTALSAIAAIEKALLCAVNSLSISLDALHITLVQRQALRAKNITTSVDSEEEEEEMGVEQQVSVLKMVTVADLRVLQCMYHSRGALLHAYITEQNDDALVDYSLGFYPTHTAKSVMVLFKALLHANRYSDAMNLVKLCVDFPTSIYHALPSTDDNLDKPADDAQQAALTNIHGAAYIKPCNDPARTRMHRSRQGVHGLQYQHSYLAAPAADANHRATASSGYNSAASTGVAIFTEQALLEVVAAFTQHCYEQQPYLNTTPYDNTAVYPVTAAARNATPGNDAHLRIQALSVSLSATSQPVLLTSAPLGLPRHHIHRTDAGVPLSTAVALPDTTRTKLTHLHLLVQQLTPLDLAMPVSQLTKMMRLRVRIATMILHTVINGNANNPTSGNVIHAIPPAWLLSFICPVAALIPSVASSLRDSVKTQTLTDLYRTLLNLTVEHLPLALPILAKAACYDLLADTVSHAIAFHALTNLYASSVGASSATTTSARSPSLAAIAQGAASLLIAACDGNARAQIKAASTRLLAHCALLTGTSAADLAKKRGVAAQDLSVYGCDAHTIALVLAAETEAKDLVANKPLSYAALSTKDMLDAATRFDASPAVATTPAPASASAFSFGATPVSAPVTAAPIAPASEVKPAFSFATPAPAPAATAAAAPAFSFGAAPTAATTSSASPFSFGASAPATAPVTAAPAPATTAVAAPAFSFGAIATAPATPAFSFGATAAPAEAPETKAAPAPAFSFGAAVAPAAAAASTFSFGAATTAATAAATPAFSFGAPAASAATETEEKPKPAFSFGASAAPAPAPETKATSALAFSFGAISSTPATPAFSFGSTASTGATAAPAFSFGASASSASTTPAFSFGASSMKQETGTFAFGKKENVVDLESEEEVAEEDLEEDGERHFEEDMEGFEEHGEAMFGHEGDVYYGEGDEGDVHYGQEYEEDHENGYVEDTENHADQNNHSDNGDESSDLEIIE